MSEGHGPWLSRVAAEIAGRALPDGTFPGRPGEEARVDATAWAACALALSDLDAPAARAGTMLSSIQGADGRLSSSPLHPGASWPTPVALLAWRALGGFDAERRRALDYLLGLAGETMERDPASPVTIDSSIAGWPWVERTFGWVAPTSLALLALDAEALGGHSRAEEGRRLLVDRQLPSGGWNYGNTRVFGSELLPAPEEAGPALSALAGHVDRVVVATSLEQVARAAERVRTPQTLCWSILALAAWGERPGDADQSLARSLELGERFGGYDVAELSLLAIAAVARRGIVAALAGSDER